ncbi:MAG: hypothetical protein M3Q58_12975 [Bacteroidota bacterium]|nr:hypothetical protein [Bacteroidota bacterium]
MKKINNIEQLKLQILGLKVQREIHRKVLEDGIHQFQQMLPGHNPIEKYVPDFLKNSLFGYASTQIAGMIFKSIAKKYTKLPSFAIKPLTGYLSSTLVNLFLKFKNKFGSSKAV